MHDEEFETILLKRTTRQWDRSFLNAVTNNKTILALHRYLLAQNMPWPKPGLVANTGILLDD
jgi:hypothetical protein